MNKVLVRFKIYVIWSPLCFKSLHVWHNRTPCTCSIIYTIHTLRMWWDEQGHYKWIHLKCLMLQKAAEAPLEVLKDVGLITPWLKGWSWENNGERSSRCDMRLPGSKKRCNLLSPLTRSMVLWECPCLNCPSYCEPTVGVNERCFTVE